MTRIIEHTAPTTFPHKPDNHPVLCETVWLQLPDKTSVMGMWSDRNKSYMIFVEGKGFQPTQILGWAPLAKPSLPPPPPPTRMPPTLFPGVGKPPSPGTPGGVKSGS